MEKRGGRMPLIRLSYTTDPDARRRLLDRARRLAAPFGTIEGTIDAGSFHCSTPIGPFAGYYRSIEDSDEIELEIVQKPWLISVRRIEHEARRFLATT
jgi:hypothetical protein